MLESAFFYILKSFKGVHAHWGSGSEGWIQITSDEHLTDLLRYQENTFMLIYRHRNWEQYVSEMFQDIVNKLIILQYRSSKNSVFRNGLCKVIFPAPRWKLISFWL